MIETQSEIIQEKGLAGGPGPEEMMKRIFSLLCFLQSPD